MTLDLALRTIRRDSIPGPAADEAAAVLAGTAPHLIPFEQIQPTMAFIDLQLLHRPPEAEQYHRLASLHDALALRLAN